MCCRGLEMRFFMDFDKVDEMSQLIFWMLRSVKKQHFGKNVANTNLKVKKS